MMLVRLLMDALLFRHCRAWRALGVRENRREKTVPVKNKIRSRFMRYPPFAVFHLLA